jgi:DNA-binding NarL/FixJ family response regulator
MSPHDIKSATGFYGAFQFVLITGSCPSRTRADIKHAKKYADKTLLLGGHDDAGPSTPRARRHALLVTGTAKMAASASAVELPRVLLVHRVKMLRTLVRMLIEALMPEIQVATAAAFGAVPDEAALGGRIDLLLLLCADQAEAVESGKASLAAARMSLGKPPAVAVMAAEWTPRVAHDLFRQGVRAIIPLPFPPDHLRAVLNLLLSGGAYRPGTGLEAGEPEPLNGELPLGDAPMAGAADPFAASALTQRQLQVLELMRQGHANKSIALRLGLRETTVKVHVKAILKRLNVRNRTQAALLANRLVRPD